MLGGLDAEEPSQLQLGAVPPAAPGALSYLSVVCLLRGRVHDALQNLPRAVQWYRAALQADPFNYEVCAGGR